MFQVATGLVVLINTIQLTYQNRSTAKQTANTIMNKRRSDKEREREKGNRELN